MIFFCNVGCIQIRHLKKKKKEATLVQKKVTTANNPELSCSICDFSLKKVKKKEMCVKHIVYYCEMYPGVTLLLLKCDLV